MNWSTASVNTNEAILKQALLAPYLVNQVRVYKCPSDRLPADNGPRLRSYAMNSRLGHVSLGPPSFFKTPDRYPGPNGLEIYNKFSQVTKISHSRLYVFAEEHPDTINDGFLEIDTTGFADIPGGNHAGIGAFSFADGHAETKKWKTSGFKQPVKRAKTSQEKPSKVLFQDNEDARWVRDRSAAFRNQ